jgi:hypothetical protein
MEGEQYKQLDVHLYDSYITIKGRYEVDYSRVVTMALTKVWRFQIYFEGRIGRYC